MRRAHPQAYARAYMTRNGGWQASFFVPPARGEHKREEVAQVLIDDRTGAVTESWTGVQVAWPMARGYPGAFGRAANAPWVWVGLCVLFVLPFLRPPLRLLHLDLAVLLAFSVSYAYFGAADLGDLGAERVPAPRLPARTDAGRREPRRRARSTACWSDPGFLLVAIVFLIGFRVVLNVVDGNVIDVGYSGVIGADRMAARRPAVRRVPAGRRSRRHVRSGGLCRLCPVRGDLAVARDAGTTCRRHTPRPSRSIWAARCCCILLGRRLRGRELGLLLAYLWMTYPFTLLVANSGANDSLVALLVLAALLAAARPVARGALVALAGLTKFAPLALAPLFATYRSSGTATASAVKTLAAFAVVIVVVLAPVNLDVFWERTLGFQQDRESPFSIWGYYELPQLMQTAAQAAAVLLAVAVAFVPRRRDPATLAALAAAVLIGIQLTVDHWFYLYLVWFAPLVWVALLTPAQGAGSARSSQRSAASSPG